MLHLIVTWCSGRSRLNSKVVKTEPTLSLRDGALMHDAMRQVRAAGAKSPPQCAPVGKRSLGAKDAISSARFSPGELAIEVFAAGGIEKQPITHAEAQAEPESMNARTRSNAA